jgi:tripartite-type tricarboxylate transporter receptor subunit TctC
MQRRRLWASTLLAGAIALGAWPALAQDKPPLRILVGFPPGGSADVLARLVGDAIRDDFAAVTVENRPGAGGRIALTAVKAPGPTARP